VRTEISSEEENEPWAAPDAIVVRLLATFVTPSPIFSAISVVVAQPLLIIPPRPAHACSISTSQDCPKTITKGPISKDSRKQPRAEVG